MSCWRGNGIKDEVEAVEMFLHLVLVFGDDHFVRTQPQGIRRLAGRRGEHHHLCAEGVGEFHAHVAEAAEAHNADLLSLADVANGAAANRW